MHSVSHAHCLAVGRCHFVAVLPSRAAFRFWASPFPSRLTNASGRIEFIIFLIMDWLFASGCSPPRLSATQLPSATDSQCSVRRGLAPRCWCALSGALGPDLRAGRFLVGSSVLDGRLGDPPLPCTLLLNLKFLSLNRWRKPSEVL